MDNNPTIPSQLGPMNTIPAMLAPAGPPDRRPARSIFNPALKWLLVAVAVVVLVFITL